MDQRVVAKVGAQRDQLAVFFGPELAPALWADQRRFHHPKSTDDNSLFCGFSRTAG